MTAPKTIWVDELQADILSAKVTGDKFEYTLTDPTTITLDRAKYKALVEAVEDATELAHGVSFMTEKTMSQWGIRVETKCRAALKGVQP